MGNCLTARPNIDDSSARFRPVSEDATKAPGRSIPPLINSSPTVQGCKYDDKPKTLSIPRSAGDMHFMPHLKAFTFNDLMNATRHFCPDSLLGQGGFGHVYKGWICEQSLEPARPGHGMMVAVKKLKPQALQGHKEWLSEINYLGQLQHPNLVKLFGYCVDGDNMLLVYEYMPKGSLEDHLFCNDARPLSWATRIKIAIGAAQGLTFLHDSEQPIIYRDLKASNILLDSEFNAKLSDFGYAKAGPTGDHTHVSTEILGTQGYAAPEYIATGRLTTKCDVYTFGVVLLELLTGRVAVDKTKPGVERNLVEWARPYLGDHKKLFRIMDTKLEGQYPKRGAYRASILALQCLSNAKLRPQMSEVLAILEQLTVMRHSISTSPFGAERKFTPSPITDNVSVYHSPNGMSPFTHRHHHSVDWKVVSSHISDGSVMSPLASPAIYSPYIKYPEG